MQKVDKFFVFMSLLVFLLSGMVIYAGHTIIQSLFTSYEEDNQEELVRVNNEKLDEVYNFSFDKETVTLEIRD